MINLGILITLLFAGYFCGSYFEKKHYKSIIDREKLSSKFPVSSFTWKERKKFDPPPEYEHSKLFIGEMVVASDYFKTFVGGLRGMLGGRLKTFESLLDRARREARLRMIHKARDWGAKEVINVKIETTNINNVNARKGSKPIIEVMVYATGLK